MSAFASDRSSLRLNHSRNRMMRHGCHVVNQLLLRKNFWMLECFNQQTCDTFCVEYTQKMAKIIWNGELHGLLRFADQVFYHTDEVFKEKSLF